MRKEFSNQSIQRRMFYEKHYEICHHVELRHGIRRQYIGSKQNRICRYCGKSSPETSFRNTSHTFPEFIGNKSLISYDECDSCNDKFSNTIEDHLARYLGIERTLAKIPGKKGIPIYTVPGKTPRIEYSVAENMLKANAQTSDGFIEVVENENRIIIHAHRQPYIKRSAYKCLTKMALAIMPENELHNFKHTLDWINKNPDDDTLKTDALICLRSRSTASLHAIDALLLRRKDPSTIVPYMTFFIQFYNFSFQIFLQLTANDPAKLSFKACHFPTKIECFSNNNVGYYLDNLSSNETVKEEEDLQSMSYDGEVTKTLIGDG